MNIAIWLERIADAYPQRPAILAGTSVYSTYGDLRGRVAALAGTLKDELGVSPGDRVAICMANHVRYFEYLFAIWWAGAVAVPVNAKLHAKEVAYILADSGSKLAIIAEDFVDDLVSALEGEGATRVISREALQLQGMSARAEPAAPHPCAPDRTAWLFYTSGTTGKPKGVMITHANLQAMAACYFTDIDQVEPDTHWLYAAPISHAAGLYGLPHFLKGARHVVPVSEKFDPAEILELGRSLQKLSLFAAPTMVRRLVDIARQTNDTGSGIRSIVYGGGPMYVADLVDGMEQFGSKFVQLYGQGESPMTITALSREDHAASFAKKDFHRLGSVGRAQSLVEVRTVLDDGRPAAAGETGEILVRGPTVMAGYWNNPAATQEAIRSGWLHTGDLGAMDAAGYLTLKDRSKDLIISGGSNIYPREIEEVLLMHDAVSEVAVIGIPDPEWGEVPIAFYTCRPGYQVVATDLEKLCTGSIARFKRPREFRLLPALPKNSYGKILKTELRRMLEAVPHDGEPRIN